MIGNVTIKPGYRYVTRTPAQMGGLTDVLSSAWGGITNVIGEYTEGQQAKGYKQAVESGKAVTALDTQKILTIAGIAVGGVVLVALLTKKK